MGARLLLVLDEQLVRAGSQRDDLGGPVHLVRRIAPQHQLAVDVETQPVVAGPVDRDRTAVRHVPVAAPPGAEMSPGKAFVLVQEVERDAVAHLGAERRPGEAVHQKEFPPQPRPLRRLRSDHQPRRRARQGSRPVRTNAPQYPAAAFPVARRSPKLLQQHPGEGPRSHTGRILPGASKQDARGAGLHRHDDVSRVGHRSSRRQQEPAAGPSHALQVLIPRSGPQSSFPGSLGGLGARPRGDSPLRCGSSAFDHDPRPDHVSPRRGQRPPHLRNYSLPG